MGRNHDEMVQREIRANRVVGSRRRLMNRGIDMIGLSTRVVNNLGRRPMKIKTVRDLTKKCIEEVMASRNFGVTMLREVQTWLKKNKLSLRTPKPVDYMFWLSMAQWSIRFDWTPFRTQGKYEYHRMTVGPIPKEFNRISPVKWVRAKNGSWYQVWTARKRRA